MDNKPKYLDLDIRSPKTVAESAAEALRTAKERVRLIANLTPGEKRTETNTLEPLNDAETAVAGARIQALTLEAVHPDKAVRAAASRAARSLIAFSTDLYTRRDIYEAVRSVPKAGLDPIAKRYRAKELLDFKLTGIDRSAAVRRRIRLLSDRNIKLGQVFYRNMTEDVRRISIKAYELKGLPADYVDSHRPDRKGNITISTGYPDYFPFMQYAQSGEARRRLNCEMMNRGWPANDAVLKELLSVRSKIARLVGFKNWADYATADKMVGSGGRAAVFLDRTAALVAKRTDADYAALLERKRRDEPGARRVESWESAYYNNLIVQEKVGLDIQKTRQYFPFKDVKSGVLLTASRLFGLKFRRVKARTWHNDVEVFDAYRGSKLLGRFYFDLHPRDGKFGHAACFELRHGLRGRQLPEAALVCNFSRGLMDHGEVTSFFHEFGHLLNFILGGGQKWVHFSGFTNEWDFVEVPSQTFEEWTFDHDCLKTFARHTKTRRPIPPELVLKLRAADAVGRGTFQGGQLFLSSLSLKYHQKAVRTKADLFRIMEKERAKYTRIKYPPHTHFYANFGHLNDYSALYYTYTWSRAISKDMLSVFRRHGLMDKKTAARYARAVLAPGGSKDATEMLRDFLGRNWNLEAFRKWLDE